MKLFRSGAVLALILAAGVQPVAAQEVSPQGCADAKELVRYLVNEGAFVQEAGLHEGVDSLANSIMVRNAVCGTPGDESYPPPTAPIVPPVEPPPTVVPPVPTPAPVTDPPGSFPSPAACLLITEKEVGAAMKQAVTANADDPLGDPSTGVAGCAYNGVGAAFTTLIYFEADAAFVYESLRSTAEANGVQAIPGLGDRAFNYLGADGPGVVVTKGDKLFALEFSGIGSGPAEDSSLLTLAQQAVSRVH